MVVKEPVIKVAAIDNGLAFPLKHPDSWRACKSQDHCGLAFSCSSQFSHLWGEDNNTSTTGLF